MELISIGFIQNTLERHYGREVLLKSKIHKYFSTFLERYNDIKYVWLDEKLYISANYKNRIKKDIENILGIQISHLKSKIIPLDMKIRFISVDAAKRKIEKKKARKKKEIEDRKNNIRNNFFSIVNKIKSNHNGFQKIGCFDLEFWESNADVILEFGWRIEDYEKGEGKTTHLIIKEHLNYKNEFYSKNNRFIRADSQLVSLDVAKERFKNEFLSEIDIMVGHGLVNDFKVLKNNGVTIKPQYLDTSDIGSIIMYENEKVSLERLLGYLHIKHHGLHNAGNDVDYTLKAFFEMGDL